MKIKGGIHIVDQTLGKLIDEFLANYRKPEDGGWAPVTEEDIDKLHEVIECLVEMKCAPDCDGDRPIEWDLTNRRTHHRLHYRPVPYSHVIRDLKGAEAVEAQLDVHQAITLNYNLATDDMDQYHRGVENDLRDKVRKNKGKE